MGFRFRKSINLGSGFKVNLSKSGVGYSWGTKGVRYTKTASGKKRTTLSIPGQEYPMSLNPAARKKHKIRKLPSLPATFLHPILKTQIMEETICHGLNL